LPEAIRFYDESIQLYEQLFERDFFQILPDLLFAYLKRFRVAVAQGDWCKAAEVAVKGLHAFVLKEEATEITAPDRERMGWLIGRIRELATEQRQQLIAAAGEAAEWIQQLLADS
jgi:hypothetical protein